MINFNEITARNPTRHNPNWPHIPDDQYWMLIIDGSGSGKTNTILNLISHQPDIDKNLYVCSGFI